MEILTQVLLKKGNKYSSVSAAWSVLSNLLAQYDGVKFGKHKYVIKVLKRFIQLEAIINRILKDLEYKTTFWLLSIIIR